jgi:hypothetical protein
MATVNKDFRVKNGLVVEGTTATVNGDIVLTEASTTFLNNLIEDTAGGLLSNATLTNITISYNNETNALTITAENGVSDSDTDDLSEGSANLYFTDERAQDAFGALVSAGTFTGLSFTYDDEANKITVSVDDQFPTHDTDDLAEGTTNLYFTDQRALDATSSAYDAAGSAATAESNANTYTDDLIGDATVDGTSGNTVTDRISSAVSNLVDSSPETLDTLNELAAALGDDPNFATTVANSIGEKVAKAGDTMTGDLTLAQDPTSNLHAATKQYVDSEVPDDTDELSEGTSNLYYTDQRVKDVLTGSSQTNILITEVEGVLTIEAENGVADSDTDDLAEGETNLYFTDQRAVDAIEAVVPAFTAVEINSSLQVAASLGLTTAETPYNAYTFSNNEYRSAKFLVKSAAGVHTQISEVLLTLDTSDNVAITEYAIVATNGNLVDITATVSAGDVNLVVTPVNANTTATVFGTLIV